MASDDGTTRYVSGSDRLSRLLSDPGLRARVDDVVEEMGLADDRYRVATEVVDGAVAAATTTVGAETTTAFFSTLGRHLTAAGVRDVGITLTVGGHEVTVPLSGSWPAPPADDR